MCIKNMVELSSIQIQVLPSDLPYQELENPTDPAGSLLSTQPTLWATTLGQDAPSCSCTPAIVERVHVHLAWPTWVQDHMQTQACLASEG